MFEAVDLLVSPRLLLHGSGGMWCWSLARSFWVIGDRGDENFEGSCAEILSTGRSLNSCVDCKICKYLCDLKIARNFKSHLKVH